MKMLEQFFEWFDAHQILTPGEMILEAQIFQINKKRNFMCIEHFVDVTDESYAKELVVNEPVVVKFHAEWCVPCKNMAPILEDLATEYAGKIKFINVDIDKTSEIAKKYAVRGVPTLLFIKDENVVNTLVGSQSKSRLQLALDTLLA